MPLTFPSHAAAVLPLKLWRRRWFDGVALTIGSAAPDLPYSLSPYVNYNAHTWSGILLCCVPLTVLLTVLTRAAAPSVVAHLRPFLTGDWAVLGARRHPWPVTVASAWLGAASHRLWDLVTHAANADRGTSRLTFLDATAFAGQPWWRVLHYGSTLVGALVVLALARHVTRTGWLRVGVATVPVAPRRPAVFWTAALVVWVPGVAVQPFLAWFTEPQAIIVRLLEVGGAGLLVAAGVVAFLSDSQVRSGSS
ncbi:DUF4184 family protein [Dactylosporangium sp. NPDC005572]|uniref:DUF4184 family protein n=1 Tax=Dactylosporangium sp. NPDC005572 TaxID=3156889 RepID=UPI0033B679FC